MPVTVKVAVDAVGDIVTTDATLATAGLLLVNVTPTLEATTGSTVTVPWMAPPTPIVAALSVMPDNSTGPVLVGELREVAPPHLATDTTASTINGTART